MHRNRLLAPTLRALLLTITAFIGCAVSDSATTTEPTDETAQTAQALSGCLPWDTTSPAWSASKAYGVGDLASFNGKTYRCKQAHTSQSDWPPTSTPALWEIPVPCGSISVWTPQTAYPVGAVVLFDGARYECLQGHTAEATWQPSQTPALWSPLTVSEACGTAVDASQPACPSTAAALARLPAELPSQGNATPQITSGSIPGTFEVSESGSSVYRLPFEVTPGVNGLQPSLGIVYNSDGGNGLVGAGFTLTGLSVISRCDSNPREDSTLRPVQYDDFDKFCLDGQKLSVTNGSYGADQAEYRTLPDTFQKIQSFRSTSSHGPDFFRVWTKDGRILDYGGPAGASAKAGNGATRVWALRKVADGNGNYILYSYDNVLHDSYTTEQVPLRIDYTGNEVSGATPQRSVQFAYEPRTDVATAYSRRMVLTMSRRLHQIKILGPSERLVHSYTLQYEDHFPDDARQTSRISLISDCTADNLCKPSTHFVYERGVSSIPPYNLRATSVLAPLEIQQLENGNEVRSASPLTTLDIDGDGKDDLFSWRHTNNTNVEPPGSWFIALSHEPDENKGFFASNSWQDIDECTPSPAGLTPLDYNQDGRVDLFQTQMGIPNNPDLSCVPPATWQVWLSNGTGFTVTDTGIPRWDQAHFADMNGDGVTDLIQCRSTADGNEWEVRFHTGSSFGASVALPMHDYPCSPQLFLTIDATGDGAADILAAKALSDDPAGLYNLFAWNGTDWGVTGTGLGFKDFPEGIDHTQLPDLNNDGLPDILTIPAASSSLTVIMNAGFGFLPPRDLGLPLERAALQHGVVVDANDDGKQDLLVFRSAAENWALLRSTGDSFQQLDSGISPQVQDLHYIASDRGDHSTLIGILREIPDDDTQPATWRYALFTTLIRNVDLVSTIEDGLQDEPEYLSDGSHNEAWIPTVQIEYRPLIESVTKDFYTSGGGTAIPIPGKDLYHKSQYTACAYPLSCVLGAKIVVSKYSLNTARADHLKLDFDVTYRDGRFDRLGRTWLGFRRLSVIQNNHVETSRYYDYLTYDAAARRYPHVGHVDKEIRAAAEQPLLTIYDPTATCEISEIDTAWDSRPTNGDRSYFTFPKTRRERRFQHQFCHTDEPTLGTNAGTTLVDALNSFSTDDYGNTTSTTTTNGNVTVTLDQSFLNDVPHWIIGRRLSTATCASERKDLSDKRCRKSGATYDGRGMLQTLTMAPDDPAHKLLITYGRDAFGNVTTTTANDTAEQRQRSSCITYDAEGLFPLARANAKGQVSYEKHHADHEQKTLAVDPNGFVNAWSYDGFGRLALQKRPDGSAVSRTYARVQGPGETQFAHHKSAGGRYEGSTFVPNGSEEEIDYDAKGRPIAVHRWVVGKGGVTQRVVERVEFDLNGNVARRVLPVADGTLDGLAERFSYDEWGRITNEFWPEGGVQYTYIGLDTVIRDSQNNATRVNRDSMGRTVEVVDANLKSTKYTYAPFGVVRTVTDPRGHVTTIDADAYGRPKAVSTQDAGPDKYTFNAYGDLRTVTNGRGQVTEILYDELGRPRQRTRPEGVSCWKWDTESNGVGEVGSIDGPANAIEYFGYDAFGRSSKHGVVSGDSLFNTTLGYDSFGRVNRLVYPNNGGGVEVAYGYDARDHLTTVKDGIAQTLWWKWEESDAAGRVTRETFGNGLTSARTFRDTQGGLLGSVQTGSVRLDGTLDASVQNLAYEYDLLRNLTVRKDERPQNTHLESFCYDKLGRLTDATIDAQVVCGSGAASHYAYDDDGNITFKSGVGAYIYDSLRPHELTKAGSNTYTYDGDGNQTKRPAGQVTYTSFNKPSTHGTTSGTVRFEYGANDSRLLKLGVQADTIYVGDIYQRTVDRTTGDVEHRYVITAPHGRVVAIVARKSAGSGSGQTSSTVSYVHVDRNGSIDALSNSEGTVVERRSYDPFGARRAENWTGSAPTTSGNLPLGFTGHEDEAELSWVNMRGRMYDPRLGRFTSRDPMVQAPLNGQAWNPYSYVLNSPMNWVDPSGYQAADPASLELGELTCSGRECEQPIFQQQVRDAMARQAGGTGRPSPTSLGLQGLGNDGVPLWFLLGRPDLLAGMSIDYAAVEAFNQGVNRHALPLTVVTAEAIAVTGVLSGAAAWETGAAGLAMLGRAFHATAESIGHAILWASVRTQALVAPGLEFAEASAGLLPGSLGTTGLRVAAAGVASGVAEEVNQTAGSIRGVNPLGSTTNCVACAISTDATLAGSRASAVAGGPFSAADVLAHNPGRSFIPSNGYGGIRTMMSRWGPGARGIVWGTRGAEQGHMFNVVNQEGVIRFLDGQSGGAAVLEEFEGLYLLRTN